MITTYRAHYLILPLGLCRSGTKKRKFAFFMSICSVCLISGCASMDRPYSPHDQMRVTHNVGMRW